MTKNMTYAGVGVNYDAMDPFKLEAQKAARTTAQNIERLGFRVLLESYGESAFIIKPTDDVPCITAHVEEGVGTKTLVADTMHHLTGKSYYDQIAQDAVAMIVNDMITLGALPLSVAMHLAVGDSNWFNDEKRCRDLIDGWKNACDLARCAWGGGETPTLKGIVAPEAVVLSGSAVGIVKPKERLISPDNIQHGDAIVLIESSGIHANGLTMARKIIDKLPNGYLTMLNNERTYGETLLDPTLIYVALIEKCLDDGVDIHYIVNITGHGWRKLMRATQSFAYIIECLPRQLPIFDFIQEQGPVDDAEAYANFNMGAGLALYAPETEVEKIRSAVESCGYFSRFGMVHAGHIERSDQKKVVIKPRGLEYSGSTLGVR